ncbi:MAG: family 20 glycosylhydrolase [Candidatus Wallbacteria bacterium]|nr:family 20 glycosylhydrolase [Candidatus Wallbacteria bacterium]
MRSGIPGIGILVVMASILTFSLSANNLMPVPDQQKSGSGKFRLSQGFTVAPSGAAGEIVSEGVKRMLARLSGRTGFAFSGSPAVNSVFNITCDQPGKLELFEDESYSLTVNPGKIILQSPTELGALHGLETLLQLLASDEQDYYFPEITINDKPRFPWRGLLIDVSRHFMPLEVLKRNLDAMASLKLNVLHLHLSDDQGFRVECLTLPELHRLCSDGNYYTQDQIRDLISYAAMRGIRVIPEFDLPGHSTSWLVAHPELASAPGPYAIERKWGVFNPTFNPSLEETYAFFDKFFAEMSALFPDQYLHIGGDENNGRQWAANQQIQDFMVKNQLKDRHSLQAYFNKRLLAILTKYGKKMIGWDEIFQPDLPKTIVVQSWRGQKSLAESAKLGYYSLLSNGYYIDLIQSAEFHYLNDPAPASLTLTDEEKKFILGGEATMWSELVSPDNIDSRIWPRTAAIAERFWSPQNVRDLAEMYRRLEIVSLQLEEIGLTHRKNQEMFMRRLCGGAETANLKVLIDVIEPVKEYKRHSLGTKYSSTTPLTRVVDTAVPDAPAARKFRNEVDHFLKSKDQALALEITDSFKLWAENHALLLPVINKNPVLREIKPLSESLRKISLIGLDALKMIASNENCSQSWLKVRRKTLNESKKPRGEAELMIVSAIEKLVESIPADKH